MSPDEPAAADGTEKCGPAEPSQRRALSRRHAVAWVAALAGAALACCAYRGYQAHRQYEAVAAIRALDGKLSYADELPLAKPWWGQRWLGRWLGRDFVSPVVVVKLSGEKVRDADLSCLEPLAGLLEVHITDAGAVTDAGLTCLRNKGSLEKVSLRGTHIGDAALAHLEGLTAMKFLDLQGTGVSDAGLKYIRNLPVLKGVNLTDTYVSADAAQQLRSERRDAFVKR